MKSDKRLHLCISLAVSLAVGLATAWWYGAAVALALGLLKEWRDSTQRGNEWSWGDIAADLAGVIPAGVIVFLIGLGK